MGMLGACAPTIRSSTVNAPFELVWPAPPQQPKIRYLYSLSEPRDIGINPGFLTRFVQIFAGRESQRMSRPAAVAADEEMIAVADPGLYAVHLYFPGQSQYEVINEAAGQPLQSPVGIALAEHEIYVADSVAGRIHVFDRQGEYRRTISDLSRPTGIAYHAQSQRLYVVDTLDNEVAVYDETGDRAFAFGMRGRANGEFNYPTHITFSQSAVYVNDTMNHRIQAFTFAGLPVSAFGENGDGSGQFALSKGIGVDSQDHIYVADGVSNYVQVFDEDGRFLLAFGGMGLQAGQFRIPSGIYVFDDKIYVTDSQNNRVQVFEFIAGET